MILVDTMEEKSDIAMMLNKKPFINATINSILPKKESVALHI